jgi:hypothetical protein
LELPSPAAQLCCASHAEGGQAQWKELNTGFNEDLESNGDLGERWH